MLDLSNSENSDSLFFEIIDFGEHEIRWFCELDLFWKDEIPDCWAYLIRERCHSLFFSFFLSEKMKFVCFLTLFDSKELKSLFFNLQ